MNELRFSTSYHNKLFKFQQKKIEDMLYDVHYAFQRNKKRTNLLKAPTGSGKTILTGVLADCLFLNIEKISIIWLCETPSITNQSKKKLNKHLKMNGYDFDEIMRKDCLPNHSIVYINWEKTKNEENAVRKDTESTNSLITLIKKTKANDSKILFVIDEAHLHTNSLKSKSFIEECDPDIVLEVTATPTKDLSSYDETYIIDVEEVQNEGLIKQGVYFNNGEEISVFMEEYNKSKYTNTFRDYILLKSLEKRDQLEKLINKYADETGQNPYVPLLAIQLPNNDESMKFEVEQFLFTLGYDRENGLAIFLDNEKTVQLDEIEDDHSIKVLIFKQAIAKGWDCPRASILTMLRSSKSEPFVVQTIGRIMRMPYLELFPSNYDALNYAYIFTDIINNQTIENMKGEINNEGNGVIVKLKEDINATSSIFKLKKQKWEESNLDNKIKENLEKHIRKTDWSEALDLEKRYIKNIISDFKETKFIFSLEERELLENKDWNQWTDEDVDKFYDVIIKSKKLKPLIKIIEKKLSKSFPKKTLREIKEIIISEENMNIIEKEINLVSENTKKTHNNIPVTPTPSWSVPTSIKTSKNAKRRKQYEDKYLYDECWLNDNSLELELAKTVNESKKVLHWMKNGDNGDKHFSITYEINGEGKLTFPDFILETEEEIYILESKGKRDEDKTFAKAKALREYDKNQKLIYGNEFKKIIVGIVTEKNGKLYIYTGSNFENEYDDIYTHWKNFSI